MENKISDKQMVMGEESIIHLSVVLGLSEKTLVKVLEAGIVYFLERHLSEREESFLEEAKATFDAY